MNSLYIKENRKKLKLNQSELAKLIGVSTKTISNYETGETIPETKKEILYKILNQEKKPKFYDIPENNILEDNFTQEPEEIYYTKSVFQKQIEKKEEEILARKNNIQDLKKINQDYSHHQTMIKLLEENIEILKIAEKDFFKENNF